MPDIETNHGDDGWMFLLYALAYSLALTLNFVPFFLSQWVNTHFPASGALLKPLLLQLVEDTQESLMLFIQPVLDTFVADTLSHNPDPDSRALIAKADSLNTVLKVWTIKFPSFAVTIASTLPRSRFSLVAIPVTVTIWFVWLWVFSATTATLQDDKKERDKALKGMDKEENHFQATYLKTLSQLNRKLVCWKVFRTLIMTAFVLVFGHTLDTTLVIRLIHQVASLESINWKETSSRIKASDILNEAVNEREKEPDPEVLKDTPSKSPVQAAAEDATTVEALRTAEINAQTPFVPSAIENNKDELPEATGEGRASKTLAATFAENVAYIKVILAALKRACRKSQQQKPDQASGERHGSTQSVSIYGTIPDPKSGEVMN